MERSRNWKPEMRKRNNKNKIHRKNTALVWIAKTKQNENVREGKARTENVRNNEAAVMRKLEKNNHHNTNKKTHNKNARKKKTKNPQRRKRETTVNQMTDRMKGQTKIK